MGIRYLGSSTDTPKGFHPPVYNKSPPPPPDHSIPRGRHATFQTTSAVSSYPPLAYHANTLRQRLVPCPSIVCPSGRTHRGIYVCMPGFVCPCAVLLCAPWIISAYWLRIATPPQISIPFSLISSSVAPPTLHLPILEILVRSKVCWFANRFGRGRVVRDW